MCSIDAMAGVLLCVKPCAVLRGILMLQHRILHLAGTAASLAAYIHVLVRLGHKEETQEETNKINFTTPGLEHELSDETTYVHDTIRECSYVWRSCIDCSMGRPQGAIGALSARLRHGRYRGSTDRLCPCRETVTARLVRCRPRCFIGSR